MKFQRSNHILSPYDATIILELLAHVNYQHWFPNKLESLDPSVPARGIFILV